MQKIVIDKPYHFVPQAGAKALVGAVVLAVNRNQFCTGFPCGVHHQLSACHQNLFIGQPASPAFVPKMT